MPSLRSLYQYALPQQVTPDVVLIADTQPEGPPSYEDAASTSINVRVLVPAHLRPTNFVYVNRSNSSIKETCAINSALEIPPSLLPPLEAGETVRKNVSMISKNGSVNGTIHLLEGGLRADLLLRSQNGSVEARVVCVVHLNQLRAQPTFNIVPYVAIGPLIPSGRVIAERRRARLHTARLPRSHRHHARQWICKALGSSGSSDIGLY